MVTGLPPDLIPGYMPQGLGVESNDNIFLRDSGTVTQEVQTILGETAVDRQEQQIRGFIAETRDQSNTLQGRMQRQEARAAEQAVPALRILTLLRQQRPDNKIQQAFEAEIPQRGRRALLNALARVVNGQMDVYAHLRTIVHHLLTQEDYLRLQRVLGPTGQQEPVNALMEDFQALQRAHPQLAQQLGQAVIADIDTIFDASPRPSQQEDQALRRFFTFTPPAGAAPQPVQDGRQSRRLDQNSRFGNTTEQFRQKIQRETELQPHDPLTRQAYEFISHLYQDGERLPAQNFVRYCEEQINIRIQAGLSRKEAAEEFHIYAERMTVHIVSTIYREAYNGDLSESFQEILSQIRGGGMLYATNDPQTLIAGFRTALVEVKSAVQESLRTGQDTYRLQMRVKDAPVNPEYDPNVGSVVFKGGRTIFRDGNVLDLIDNMTELLETEQKLIRVQHETAHLIHTSPENVETTIKGMLEKDLQSHHLEQILSSPYAPYISALVGYAQSELMIHLNNAHWETSPEIHNYNLANKMREYVNEYIVPYDPNITAATAENIINKALIMFRLVELGEISLYSSLNPSYSAENQGALGATATLLNELFTQNLYRGAQSLNLGDHIYDVRTPVKYASSNHEERLAQGKKAVADRARGGMLAGQERIIEAINAPGVGGLNRFIANGQWQGMNGFRHVIIETKARDSSGEQCSIYDTASTQKETDQKMETVNQLRLDVKNSFVYGWKAIVNLGMDVCRGYMKGYILTVPNIERYSAGETNARDRFHELFSYLHTRYLSPSNEYSLAFGREGFGEYYARMDRVLSESRFTPGTRGEQIWKEMHNIFAIISLEQSPLSAVQLERRRISQNGCTMLDSLTHTFVEEKAWDHDEGFAQALADLRHVQTQARLKSELQMQENSKLYGNPWGAEDHLLQNESAVLYGGEYRITEEVIRNILSEQTENSQNEERINRAVEVFKEIQRRAIIRPEKSEYEEELLIGTTEERQRCEQIGTWLDWYADSMHNGKFLSTPTSTAYTFYQALSTSPKTPANIFNKLAKISAPYKSSLLERNKNLRQALESNDPTVYFNYLSQIYDTIQQEDDVIANKLKFQLFTEFLNLQSRDNLGRQLGILNNIPIIKEILLFIITLIKHFKKEPTSGAGRLNRNAGDFTEQEMALSINEAVEREFAPRNLDIEKYLRKAFGVETGKMAGGGALKGVAIGLLVLFGVNFARSIGMMETDKN